LIAQPELVKKDEGQGVRLTSHDDFIQLGLRSRSLEQEIEEACLPGNSAKLLDMALQSRHEIFNGRYNQVAVWIEMKKHGDFYKKLGYRTLEDLWIELGLPGGTTLAYWENIVRTFDKDTYLLIGDDCLSYLVRYISSFQSDSELRRRDYQQIFEAYTANNNSFDTRSFRRQINLYVNSHYVAPALDEPKQTKPKKVQTRRMPVNEPCPECTEKGQLLTATISHIESLENFIADQLGRAFIPHRPGRLLEAAIVTGRKIA
jgi:hypothetical protein